MWSPLHDTETEGSMNFWAESFVVDFDPFCELFSAVIDFRCNRYESSDAACSLDVLEICIAFSWPTFLVKMAVIEYVISIMGQVTPVFVLPITKSASWLRKLTNNTSFKLKWVDSIVKIEAKEAIYCAASDDISHELHFALFCCKWHRFVQDDTISSIWTVSIVPVN